jgi:hypothetical protein
MMTSRIAAAEALVKALRTGELSAAGALEPLLDDGVELETNGPTPGAPTETYRGRSNVLWRLSGNWAVTYALRNARWTAPVDTGERLEVGATFENLGGVVPTALAVAVALTDSGKIRRIEQRYTPRQPPPPLEVIPASARPLINNARANETPIAVAHTDENGDPSLTFRGSIQVWSDTALCAWIRQGEGGLARSIAKNPKLSLIYRDGARAMLMMQGRARLDPDDAVRQRVFALIPEQEQNHDPGRKGVAMIIELDRMQGYSTGGEPVRMVRKS